MNNLHVLTLSVTFSAFVFFQACGSSGTVRVVEQAPQTVSDTTETAAETDSTTNGFQELRIGLIEPVTNYDPLFADNLSTLRVISLIYDGLFTLTTEGEPVPSMALDFEVSDDGTQYLIRIDRRILFHDSSVFASGVGRRIHAEDVKWAFERTASLGVPGYAAPLLMNVIGYENYYMEQHQVFDADKRVLDGVSGIRVINAETVLIVLNEEDPQFLHKLASPYLSIYPREALRNNGEFLKSRPVGTGPYIIHQATDENQLILVKQQNNNANQSVRSPLINRIEFSFFEFEPDLFQLFVRDGLDWIPELGPRTKSQVVANSGELFESYSGNFDLTRMEASRLVTLYLNDGYRGSGMNWLQNRIQEVTEDKFSHSDSVQINRDDMIFVENAVPDTTYFAASTDDPFVRNIYASLNDQYLQPESELAFFDIHIPTPQTVFYSRTGDSLHAGWLPQPETFWLRIQIPIVSVSQKYIEGITTSSVPWKLFIENIQVNRESL